MKNIGGNQGMAVTSNNVSNVFSNTPISNLKSFEMMNPLSNEYKNEEFNNRETLEDKR